MSEKNNEETLEKVSFEQKLENSKELLNKLIDPEITLSDSVEVYKAGMSELQEAQKLLEEAKFEFEALNESH